MTDEEILGEYIHLVPFLSKVLGPECEIAVYEKTQNEMICRKVENPIEGREETEWEPMLENSEYRINGSGKNCLFSRYYIRNDDRIIGMLGIYRDTSTTDRLVQSIHEMLTSYNLVNDAMGSDLYEVPITEIVHRRIEAAIRNEGIPVENMSIEEKTRLAHKLDDEHLLAIKGAIPDLADQLQVSVPTIYRYLKK